MKITELTAELIDSVAVAQGDKLKEISTKGGMEHLVRIFTKTKCMNRVENMQLLAALVDPIEALRQSIITGFFLGWCYHQLLNNPDIEELNKLYNKEG